MIKLKFINTPRDAIWVTGNPITIGSSNVNLVSLEGADIESEHLRIFQQDKQYQLVSLSPKHNTYVNDQSVTNVTLAVGDIIRIGEILIQVIDPKLEYRNDQTPYWSLIADSNWLTGQEFPLDFSSSDALIVGRGTQSHLVFPGTHLSRRHAEIKRYGDILCLTDQGSSNGTFVNGKKISEPTQVFAGDRIGFDVYHFIVFGPKATSPLTAANDALDLKTEKSTEEKQWKSKPTSPGNREDINLYKKNYKPLLWAGGVLIFVILIALFVIINLLQN